MKENEKAIENLESKLPQLRDKHDIADLQENLLSLGSLYLDSGDVPKSLTVIEEALSLAEDQTDPINGARLWGLKGLAITKLGNDKQALKAFKTSLTIAEKINHIPIKIDALTQIGKLQFKKGEVEKGIKNLEIAYRSAFDTGDRQREMYIAGIMGNTFLLMDQHGKAMEFFSIALDTSKILGKLESESQYQLVIGHIYLSKEDYGPAEEHFQNALNIGSKLKNQQIEFSAFECLHKLGVKQDNIELSIFNGNQAIRLAGEIKDIGAEAENIKLLGHFLISKGEYKKAIPYLERGLELAVSAHDKEWQIDMITNLGFSYYYQGLIEKSEDCLYKAYELATQLQKPIDLAHIGGKLSAVLADKGEILEAVKYCEEAIQIARVHNLTELEGEQLTIQAINYHELGREEEAEEYIQEALNLYKKIGQPDLLKKVEGLLKSFK